MIRFYLAAALLAASPAAAGATVTGCEVELANPLQASIRCDVHNSSDRAIASIVFRAIVKSPGREVPWVTIGYGLKETVNVPGGIEPGETARLAFSTFTPPERSKDVSLVASVIDMVFLDVTGARIGLETENEYEAPMDKVSESLDNALSP